MNSVREFLAHCGSLGIKLQADHGELRCRAPAGALTPNLVSQLKKYKAEILELLERVATDLAAEPETIRPVPRRENMPLSFSQQRLWLWNAWASTLTSSNWVATPYWSPTWSSGSRLVLMCD